MISVKNPTVAANQGLQKDKKAEYPEELQKLFEGRRWIPVDPPSLLDYEGNPLRSVLLVLPAPLLTERVLAGTEILLVGAHENIKEYLGETGAELESWAQEDMTFSRDSSLFQQLKLSKQQHPPEPLVTGDWA